MLLGWVPPCITHRERSAQAAKFIAMTIGDHYRSLVLKQLCCELLKGNFSSAPSNQAAQATLSFVHPDDGI